MITAVIVEDEKSSMEYLSAILTKNHSNIKILATASNVDDAVMIIETHSPDIVFLDIQIQNGSGFDVLDTLKQKMPFEVIFTTGFLDYKEKAMDYFAFYYLNKPVQEKEIKKVLDMYMLKHTSFDIHKYAAFRNQIRSRSEIISIIVKDEYVTIKLSHILYLEAAGNYTFIHTIQGDKYLSSKNLKRIEDMIENDAFLRVHRSTLVNMKYIKNISKDGIINMSNDAEILISIRNKKKVLTEFKLYKTTQN